MVLLTDTSNRDGNPTEARVMNAIEENMKNYLNVRTVGIVGCGLTGMSWAASIPATSSLYLRERRGGEVRLYDAETAQPEIAGRFIGTELPKLVRTRAEVFIASLTHPRALPASL